MNPTIEQVRENAPKASKMLKALAHPERLMILCHLLGGEQNVGVLMEQSQLSQSAFSQHLARLRKEGLVKTRKKAQVIYYSLDNPSSTAILDTLRQIYCPLQ
jgi:DNA-binding transcriptional ArsR family regulator